MNISIYLINLYYIITIQTNNIHISFSQEILISYFSAIDSLYGCFGCPFLRYEGKPLTESSRNSTSNKNRKRNYSKGTLQNVIKKN